MSEPSNARRELEASLRSILPEHAQMGNSMTSSKPTVAAVGLGGVITGYCWGWVRGRRARKKR